MGAWHAFAVRQKVGQDGSTPDATAGAWLWQSAFVGEAGLQRHQPSGSEPDPQTAGQSPAAGCQSHLHSPANLSQGAQQPDHWAVTMLLKMHADRAA